jgi:hypothetical protein
MLPSIVRLNSTARVSPTRTYSRRRRPSSSVSPGMIDPSVDSGFMLCCGNEGRLVISEGPANLSLDEFELAKKHVRKALRGKGT